MGLEHTVMDTTTNVTLGKIIHLSLPIHLWARVNYKNHVYSTKLGTTQLYLNTKHVLVKNTEHRYAEHTAQNDDYAYYVYASHFHIVGRYVCNYISTVHTASELADSQFRQHRFYNFDDGN